MKVDIFPPSLDEVHRLVTLLGGVTRTCEVLRIGGRNTIYRWINGNNAIDYCSFVALKYHAGELPQKEVDEKEIILKYLTRQVEEVKK